MPTKAKDQVTVYLEAHAKSVKRALKAVDTGFSVVEVRASDNAAEEHGKTTLVYTHKLDAAQHVNALNQLTKQVSIEEHDLLQDDPEEDA